MRIFGKGLSEYVAFSKWFIVLIAVVGVARLALSLGGASWETVRWISMNAVLWIGVVYLSIRAHTTGFGTYRHLKGVLALPNLTGQGIAIVAIAIAIFTGTDNAFSVPEAAFGADGKTWTHLGAHLGIGTTVGTLVAWLSGCLVMFVSRKVAPRTS
jgi:EamA domain-containing membrane protein RarD